MVKISSGEFSGFLFKVLILAALSMPSYADVYKCQIDGVTTYQGTPCKSGRLLSSTKSNSEPIATTRETPIDRTSATAIKAELERVQKHQDELFNKMEASKELEQKYQDKASQLRSEAAQSTRCGSLQVEASGNDSLAIKYPNDPVFKAKAEAAYRRLEYECR